MYEYFYLGGPLCNHRPKFKLVEMMICLLFSPPVEFVPNHMYSRALSSTKFTYVFTGGEGGDENAISVGVLAHGCKMIDTYAELLGASVPPSSGHVAASYLRRSQS